MAAEQHEASAGSNTPEGCSPETASMIVIGLAQGAKKLLVDDPELLKNLCSAVKNHGLEKCLKVMVMGGTSVAVTGLVGLGLLKLWTWLTIKSISTGSVIYHVSVPTTRVVELQRLVDSGDMKKSLDEILKNPKKFLESIFLEQHEIDKVLRILPKELTISSLHLREDNESAVVADDQSSSKATGSRSADGRNTPIRETPQKMAEGNVATIIHGDKGEITGKGNTYNIQNPGGKGNTAAAIFGDHGKFDPTDGEVNVGGGVDEEKARMITKLRDEVKLTISSEEMTKLLHDLKRLGINKWSDFGDATGQMLTGLLPPIQENRLLKYCRDNFDAK